jgi:L-fuculose-phosphate aldolase
MNYKELIVSSGLKMLNSGMTVETWGNISARDPRSGWIYLTPSGMDYSKINEADVVVCDPDGNILEGHRKPTIEKDLHLEIYKRRDDVNAIVHTHPIYSTVFSCMGEDIPPIIDEAAQVLMGECRRVDYALPGTAELAENCVKALGDTAMSCLLQSHGAVCVGKDMDNAFKVSKVLEMTAEIYYRIRATGGTPIPISNENIEYMIDFMKNKYGQK